MSDYDRITEVIAFITSRMECLASLSALRRIPDRFQNLRNELSPAAKEPNSEIKHVSRSALAAW
jgi:hypothetical protein